MKKPENFNEMGNLGKAVHHNQQIPGLIKCQLGYMTPADYQNTEEPFLTTLGLCKSVNRNESKSNKNLYITHLDIQ